MTEPSGLARAAAARLDEGRSDDPAAYRACRRCAAPGRGRVDDPVCSCPRHASLPEVRRLVRVILNAWAGVGHPPPPWPRRSR